MNFFGKPIDFHDHCGRQMIDDLIYDTEKASLIGGRNVKYSSVAIWKTKSDRWFKTSITWGFNNYMESREDYMKIYISPINPIFLKCELKDYGLYDVYNLLYAFDIEDA